MLLPIHNNMELEFVPYQGDVKWGRDIEGDISRLAVHPKHTSNFIVGYIREPFAYGRDPLPLLDWVVRWRMRIARIRKGWLGVTYQLMKGLDYYEIAECFTGTEDWVTTPCENYYVHTKASPKQVSEWFDFEVSLMELMQYAGYDLDGGQICRLGVGGDIQRHGYCLLNINDLEICLRK